MCRLPFLLLLLSTLAACASLKAQENAKLEAAVSDGGGYRLDNLSSDRSADELLIVVAFTGGGQIGYNWQTGPLVLGDEFTPDGCRLWDAKTGEKLDKDRFRRDLGDVIGHYRQVAQRIGAPL